MTKFWSDDPKVGTDRGYALEARAQLAQELIRYYAVVAAKAEGEDTAGRSRLVLQPPHELVDRAFAISDAFFAKAEERQEVRPALPAEQAATAAGLYEAIASAVRFEKNPADALAGLFSLPWVGFAAWKASRAAQKSE